MGIQLKVKNFRCLRNVDWSPDGVCMLVGPNGSGKTTLFDALKFLRVVFELDPMQAMSLSGGAFFRNIESSGQEAVHFSLAQGPWQWILNVISTAGPSNLQVFEIIQDDAGNLFRKGPGEPSTNIHGTLSPGSTALKALESIRPGVLSHPIIPFISTVRGFRGYGIYANEKLRESGSQITAEMQLSLNGQNAFSVLRNWRDKRDYRPAFEYVVKEIGEAFPGVCHDIEFDFAGTITGLRLVDSRWGASIPVAFAPNGWLTGLLHLMAVAGAASGTVVTIDEFENSLHPYAIRRIVQAIRRWAADKKLTVILAGHSSALLDEFKEYPSQVFVMEPWQSGQTSMPLRLTDYRDPEWLKHFSLGELYRHEEFGGPKETLPNGVPAVSA